MKTIEEKLGALGFVDAQRLTLLMSICREAARRGYEAGFVDANTRSMNDVAYAKRVIVRKNNAVNSILGIRIKK